MNDQYYTREPSSQSRPADCSFSYRGKQLRFHTDSGVFSRGELDQGTQLLLEALPPLHGAVLDVGCGWGAVGVSVAAANPSCSVTMVDVNLRALALAEQNAAMNRVHAEVLESDGCAALRGCCFDAVITNPPIRAGKQVIYRIFSEARDCLKLDGSLWLVIRKQQGAESAMRWLEEQFPQVRRVCRDKGFWVIRCDRSTKEANKSCAEEEDA